ncbi:MAG: hypothetical protein ACWGMZ_05505, partial [Thermoguttaceae bacterium]
MAEETTAARQPGPAQAEFQKIFSQWKTLVGELGALRAKYRTAPKAELPDLKNQWQETVRKGFVLQDKLLSAAENAFAEAPNTDKQVVDLLLEMFNAQMQTDDYENAARLGKLLVENHAGDIKTVCYTGIASFYIGNFDDAEKYFGIAEKDMY